ncbi:hypothetical protein BLNAU_23809 [Blattamonas nauphoetae]|uniref:Uncharacterized protein n=1 Tax=Blattamonas nauphoetae TaxID=2049346 RepID=A0ABQ9WP49_9EUKA|nr:hypothetical protein BLNAU_23809 [Blattamonas nauphoetae]
MSVLLEGSNVPRLIHIEFGTPSSSSKAGTAEVSTGTYGVLPVLADGKKYTLQSAAISGFSLVVDTTRTVFGAIHEQHCWQIRPDFGDTLIRPPVGTGLHHLVDRRRHPVNPQMVLYHTVVFTAPSPPHQRENGMYDPLCTSVSFVFEGQKLSRDVTFVTKISDTALTFTTSFFSSTSGQSEPIEVWPSNPLPLAGFTIVSMEETNANPARWVIVDRVSTIFPQAAITGVTCTLDHTATTYTITFTSPFLSTSPLEVELKDDLNNPSRVQAILADGVLTATEVISSVPPNNVLPGRTYTVVSSSNASINIRPSLSFTTPLPPKVLSAEAACANVMCTTMNIVLRGQEFLTNRAFLLSLDGITAPIPFSCDTQTSATIGPLQIGTGFDFAHSTTYTLISIVEDTITDPRHILCDGSCLLGQLVQNVMCTTMNIVLQGQAFLTDRTFLLVLDGITEPIPFLCETRTSATIGPLQIGTGFDFTHSTTYTLRSIVEDAVTDPHQILCDGVTFTTPSAPRLPTVYASSWNGDDGWNCGEEPDPCKTIEHAFTRLSNGKSTLLLQGTFTHVSVWEILFSSLVISHNRVLNDVGSAATHSTVRVRKGGGLVVDGPTETRFESLSFVLPSSSAVEAYAEIKTGLLTIMNCLVTGDVSTSSSFSARHSSFVKTRTTLDLVRLTTTQLEHLSVTTLLSQQSVGLTQILKWEAESIHTQSAAGSAAFLTLSNTSSLDLSSSSFTSCSSSNTNLLAMEWRGGGVGLAFSSDSSNNYLLDTLTFAHNTATFGRDLFLVAESLEKTVTIDHFLFNLHPPGFDRSNALPSVDERGVWRESHPCLSLRDSMDHLLNADSEEEVTQCVLERSLVLMGDFVFGEEDDVELCGYVSVGQQAGLVLSIIPVRTHKGTQTDPLEFGRVRFDKSGSLGCRLSFGLSEVVPPQTVLMKHLEFVLPLFSAHPRPIIAVQSVSLSLIDCAVTSISTTQAVCSLLSFHTTLTSMTTNVRLSVSHLVAQNLILSQPLLSIRSSADLPPLMDSMSTGHSRILSQTLPFSLPPCLSIENSVFDCVCLQIDATHENPIETGSVIFSDLSLPLSMLSMRDCSFSSCSTIIVSVPAESDLLSSFHCGVCCFSLSRSHLTLTDSSFTNCSFSLDPACVITPSPTLLALTSHTLAVRFLPSQNITTLSSPLSAARINSPLMAKIQSANQRNPSFLFDDTPMHSPLSSHLELVGVEMVAGSSLDPLRPLPLALFVSDRSTPSLSTHSCVFRFDTADPLNVGLSEVRVRGGAWPAQRNMLFVNCTSSRREES